jgi:hypothetical protein
VNKRENFAKAWGDLYSAICALSIGDIDSDYRRDALGALERAKHEIEDGFKDRDLERQKEDEARILKAYREGRVTVRE